MLEYAAGQAFVFTCLYFIFAAYMITRDVFHPTVMGGLFLLATVFGSALSLGNNFDIAVGLGATANLWYYTFGALMFCLGALMAGGRPKPIRPYNYSQPTYDYQALFRASITLSAISWSIYIAQTMAGGGFERVYTQVKGRGDLGSGIQDFIQLAIPAALIFHVYLRERGVTLVRILILFMILAPVLAPGLLSSRRGPTAIALAAAYFGWYLIRRRRPSVLNLLLSCAAGGFLLVFLVAFRSDIYIGSDLLSDLTLADVTARIQSFFSKPVSGHEFIFSGFVIQNADLQGDYWWGRRYAAAIFVWLVPSLIFPNKYTVLGLEGMLYNGGTTGTDLSEISATWSGAAPMLLSDVYVEFWYFGLIFVFLLGWVFGKLWRRMILGQDEARLVYACCLCLLIYLFSQTFNAFSQRLVVIAVPGLIAWWYVKRRSQRLRYRSAILSRI